MFNHPHCSHLGGKWGKCLVCMPNACCFCCHFILIGVMENPWPITGTLGITLGENTPLMGSQSITGHQTDIYTITHTHVDSYISQSTYMHVTWRKPITIQGQKLELTIQLVILDTLNNHANLIKSLAYKISDHTHQ